MRRFAILLALTGLLAAGCGGGGGGSSEQPLTKDQYKAQLQQLSNEVGTQLKQSLSASTTLQKSDVPKLQSALRDFADKVEALNPPAEVADLNTRLASASRALADAVPDIVDTVRKATDASTAIAALFGSKAIQDLIALQNAYKAKGYDISSLLNAG